MSRLRLTLLASTILAVIVFFVFQSVRWSGAKGAERAHREFLSKVEDRRPSKYHAMISDSYSDRWDYRRNDISLALQDLGSPFTFGLTIEWTPSGAPQPDSDGVFAVTGTTRIDGTGSPVAGIVISQVNAYAAEPFTFRWQREGLLPWRWRLVSIDHPDLEVPSGYTPGDLGSAASARF